MTLATLLERRGTDIVLKRRGGQERTNQRVLIYPYQTGSIRRSNGVVDANRTRYILIGDNTLQVRANDQFSFQPAGGDAVLNMRVVHVEEAYVDAKGQRHAQAELVE